MKMLFLKYVRLKISHTFFEKFKTNNGKYDMILTINKKGEKNGKKTRNYNYKK